MPTVEEEHQLWMERALTLAARAEIYETDPNPRVGAVLVRDGKVLGEGFHARVGGPHAEANAFAAAGEDTVGATLYVTLEPCGPMPNKRTPPCIDAVRAARLKRVVVAMVDPHEAVSGASLDLLRADDVDVVVGVREPEARRLNQPYCKWAAQRNPYVTAKWAMSLDGKIAAPTGDARWISGEASRRAVHVLRGRVDAIAVGIGTALADDPLLTRRDVSGKSPLRVVLDAQARLPLSSMLVSTAADVPVLVCAAEGAPDHRVEALREAGVEVALLPAAGGGGVEPKAALGALGERGVRHLLLEGGGQVLASWFAGEWIDAAQVFVAPKIVGGAAAPTPVAGAGVARIADALAAADLEVGRSGEDALLLATFQTY